MDDQFLNRPVAASLYDAFRNEPFYLAIAGSRRDAAKSEKEVLLKYFDFCIREASKYGIFYTLEDPSLGASLWLKPLNARLEKQKASEKEAFIEKYLGNESKIIYKKMAGLMAKMEINIIGKDDWYLSILAIATVHQKKGYGTQLLKPILAEADKQGVNTYLETFTESNLLFYGKLGYQVALEYFEPTLRKTCWIMLRKGSS